MHKKRIVLIGAGVGSLAAANLLQKAGHEVAVYEAASTPGGRAGQRKENGFTFDTGPSWYLMPDVFEQYYQLLGTSAAAELQPIRLTPAYKVFFEHDEPVTIRGNIDTDAATFERIEPGAGEALRRYVARSDEIYRLSLQHFLYTNFTRPLDMLAPAILRRAGKLLYLAGTTIDQHVSRSFTSKRLQQILEYPAVFLGVSPFSAPAIYSMMSALDFKEGVFYPKHGMYAIIESLVSIGSSLGVAYHFDAPVSAITVAHGAASGLTLADGTQVNADIVISGADLHHTETTLLTPDHQTYGEAYWKKKQASPSALLVYLGIQGKLPELEHHNLLFVDAWRENFDAMYTTKQAPAQASMYISKTSHTEAHVAPEGNEAVFVLVPLPAGVTYDQHATEQLVEQYLAQAADMTGIDFASRTVSRSIFSPSDFGDTLRSWQNSMLGQSHTLSQSAFFRTRNKSKKVDNLYYVGGNTLPGVGVPMCLISAELVYKHIAGDTSGGPVRSIARVKEVL